MNEELMRRSLLATAAAALLVTGSAAADNPWIFKGPHGGSILSIAADPHDVMRLYAATNRSLYRSSNAGRSWEKIFELGSHSSHALLIRVQPGNSETLYLATPARLLISRNGGESWQIGCDTSVDALAVSPSDVWIASPDRGILRSKDAGLTWTSADGNLPVSGFFATSLAVDPLSPSAVYAAGMAGIVLKTNDGGSTWRLARNGLPSWAYVNDLKIAPSAPDTLFAATSAGVFKSTNGAESWTGVGSSTLPTGTIATMEIDPVDASRIYAALAEYDAPHPLVASIYSSRDGGETWTPAPDTTTYTEPRSIAVTASGRIVVGTIAGGIYTSDDAGTTWLRESDGIAESDVRSAALSADGAVLYAGSFENGLFVRTDGKWNRVPGLISRPPALAVAAHPTDHTTAYCGSVGRVAMTADGGRTWTVSFVPTQVDALAVDPLESHTVYAGGLGGLAKSVDAGQTWQLLDLGLESDVPQVLQIVVDPTAPSTLYAGVVLPRESRSALLLSLDAGESWKPAPHSCMPRMAVAENPSLIYCTAGNQLRKIVGGSFHVTSIDTALPGTILALTRGSDDALYALVDGDPPAQAQVFRSIDFGNHWLSLSEQPPPGSLPVHLTAGHGSLLLNTRDGLYELQLAGPRARRRSVRH